MESIEKFSMEMIACLDGFHKESMSLEKSSVLATSVRFFIDEALRVIKNINETSLPGADRTNRILELEKKYGIPKTHIL